MDKKTLVRFNVQNIKYALPDGEGGYATPVAYGTAISMALEPDSATKVIYGDGRRICSIVNERGKTGTMGTNNVSNDYEIAMGRKIKTAKGLADIKQQRLVSHAIYFETCGIDEEGGMPIAKTWLYGVTSPTRPSSRSTKRRTTSTSRRLKPRLKLRVYRSKIPTERFTRTKRRGRT